MKGETHHDELLDLLAEKASAGLDAEPSARLEALLVAATEKEDHFELTAAALELSVASPLEELPATVEARLRREARRFAAGLPRSNVRPFRLPAKTQAETGSEKREDSRPAEVGTRPSSAVAAPSPLLPWLVAAVFFLAAVTGWWRVFTLAGQIEVSPSGPFAGTSAETTIGPIPQSPNIARAALLQGADPALPVPWTGTEDPAAQGVSGDVVWSPERQQGFLRFQNLPANDTKVYQYQLWIFDGTRDERFPIDGGVFDVPASGEVVIPIEAKLRVREATIFAVTIEKPGGVVVSSRERIVVLAKLI